MKKICRHCKKFFKDEDVFVDSKSKHYLYYSCKLCNNTRMKKYNHKITNINILEKTADCKICGLVYIELGQCTRKRVEESLVNKISFLYQYHEWRINVMRKDNYHCIDCKAKGRQRTILIFPNLPVLYVLREKTIKQTLEDLGIKNEQEASLCDELWDIKKGMTVCIKCYYKRRKKQ